MLYKQIAAGCLLALSLLSTSVIAEDIRYVTDELSITIHRAMSMSSDIVAQLQSGTRVKVLKTNKEEGFVMVATENEKVGWMLESFLLNEPAGREQYQTLRREYDKLKAEFDLQLQERTASLSTELKQVKSVSKRPLELQQENQRLKKLLDEERALSAEIKQENKKFKSFYKDRQWFMMGAITAIGSLVLGLIITKIPWRKRKSWGEL